MIKQKTQRATFSLIILLFFLFFLIAATPAHAQQNLCSAPFGWSPYTIEAGDTLFEISQRIGVGYEDLANANCIENPRRIFAGQVIYVPIPALPEQLPVMMALIRPNDNGREGALAGCGDSGILVPSDHIASGNLQNDLALTLQDMFAVRNVFYNDSHLFNSFDGMNIRVDNAQVFGDHAIINLSGNLLLMGACADARMRDQLLLNIFQYPAINSAFITINGLNLKQLFDQSGETGEAEPFMRSSFTQDRCPIPANWFAYTIERGDTLFKIGERSQSNFLELARVNCIENPRRIFAGNVIYAPNPVEPDNKLFLIRLNDQGASGVPVGCSDSGVFVASRFRKTDNLTETITETLNDLFSLERDAHANEGMIHTLSDSSLRVDNVTITDDTALINLNGTLPLSGVCGDARKEAQILLTIFQYDEINRAVILLNGMNLKQIFDLSGTVSDNAMYERSRFIEQQNI